ncbi:hypothetical protein [Komagataeibacter sp. FNDCF1]|uniref:hypothetical protein n=1 Tax=Komagataeibacter sp. FNDCF1 TaxID=2878681 RepID=UPI001E34493C|nr:hypothetical protein [Komagataeibacter sp. FNDCF1]MCE2563532.1 hypothetical protein [Komagataeibacter sp. FNDCF1]
MTGMFRVTAWARIDLTTIPAISGLWRMIGGMTPGAGKSGVWRAFQRAGVPLRGGGRYLANVP